MIIVECMGVEGLQTRAYWRGMSVPAEELGDRQLGCRAGVSLGYATEVGEGESQEPIKSQ